MLEADGPVFIEVPIDPEQTYYPKISSAVQADGSMKSNPLHRMSPDLPPEVEERVSVYLGATVPEVSITASMSGTKCNKLTSPQIVLNFWPDIGLFHPNRSVELNFAQL